MKKKFWFAMVCGIQLFGLSDYVLAQENYGTGAIPDPTPVVEQPSTNTNTQLRSTLPERFDPRGGLDVSVKNQGNRNLCWAFSATGAIETALLKKEGKEYDFSELYLDYLFAHNPDGVDFSNKTAYDRGVGAGEQEYVPLYGAIRWNNPVNEEVLPYSLGGQNISLDRLKEKPEIHLQGMIALPALNRDYTNEERLVKVNRIKEQLYTNGGLTYQWRSGYLQSPNHFNSEQAAVYVPQAETNEGIDHSCLIIGWDDQYSKENFVTQPQDNGAFIVKNSWGSGWGDEGYYYVSYEDFYVAVSHLYGASQTETRNNYDVQYSHTDYYSHFPQQVAAPTYTLANVFDTVNDKEVLKAVSLHTMQYDTPYEIFVNENGSDLSNLNQLIKVAEGVKKTPGIETIKLDNPVDLAGAEKFSIVIRFQKPDNVEAAYVLLEAPWVSNKSKNVVVNKEESFISYSQNAEKMSFVDLKDYWNANVYIHAFTDRTDVVHPEKVEIANKKEKMRVQYSQPQTFTASVIPAEAKQEIIWRSADTEIATVDSQGQVTAKKVGRTTITAVCEEDPSLSDSFTVVTDDYSSSYNEPAYLQLGQERSGYLDYDTAEAFSMTSEYNGDRDMFCFVAPEDGEYVYYDYADSGKAMLRHMWFYDTGSSGYKDFGSFQTFSMKKGERLFVSMNELTFSFLPYKLMNIGGSYKLIVEKKEAVNYGEIAVSGSTGNELPNQTLSGRVGQTMTLNAEVVNSTVRNPNYKNIKWKSSDESIVSVDSLTGEVSLKKAGKAKLTVSNQYAHFYSYSNLSTEISVIVE